MKKFFRIFAAMMLAVLIAMSAVAPAFAQAEQGIEQRDEQFVTYYKYDEDGRLMYRIWSIAYDYWITDWQYV